MKQYIRGGLALASLLATVALCAQVVNTAFGDYRLTLGANFPRNFTIGGTLYTTGSAFNVRGDQMGPGYTTGEVFRTVAPAANSTYWRMFSGGVAAGNERGQLYALTGQNHFNINAPNGHLRLYTNSVERARMNENISTTINGSSSFKPGFVGLSPGGSLWSTGPGPFSRLHLDDGTGLITNPYRPWMRNGISMTGNDDFMYVGQLYRAGFDESDAVIAWGDNALPPAGPDHLRFLFMGDATDVEGTEVTRITGDGYFGIGDFDAASVQPDERLDLLSRTARIRQLPNTTYQAPTSDDDKVMVVRADGRLNWRDASTLTAQDCDWFIDPSTGNVVTAFWPGPLAPTCPDQTNNVGIGTSTPSAKLDVVRLVNSGGATSTGFNLRMGTTSTNNEGGNADVQTTAPGLNTGWRASTRNGGLNWGLDGNAAVNSLANTGLWGGVRVVGVRGFADGNGVMLKPNVRGVWGVAIGALNAAGGPTVGYAGWFDGDVNIQGGDLYLNQVFAISDASVKTNVEELENAGDLIGQLNPKTYFFDTLAHTELGLPAELQRGLLASDVEQVLPELVTEVEHEARYDTLGNEIAAAYTLKAVNYIGLIPLLLANAKEQQSVISGLQQQVQAVQAQLAQCCSTGATDSRLMQQGAGSGSAGLETDLRIIPNPVAANTQLRYTVGTPGRVRLEVSDGTGRVIEVLEESTRSTGEFTYDWNTQQLNAGTYYCTLFVNDEPLVKKAVKLNER